MSDAPQRIGLISDGMGRWALADVSQSHIAVHYFHADFIKELEAENRELALQVLAAEGQAADAYQAQLAAEAKLEKAVDGLAKIERAYCQPATIARKAARMNDIAWDTRDALEEPKGGE